jgi:uncharacterized repeat protein (TIGR01451 family)
MHPRRLLVRAAVALVTIPSATAVAGPTLRHQADLTGDVVVVGSSLAIDCGAGAPQPSGVTVSCAGQANVADTAPDLYFRDDIANATITATQARTSATLDLPAGATVKYARLYWAALKVGDQPDKTVTLDYLGGPPTAITADQTWSQTYGFASHPDWFYYQSSADVTQWVSTWGPGDFRVTDVEGLALAGVDVDRAFSAWTLVVFYENKGDELRNLALFDGFTPIDPTLMMPSASVNLSGFLVPPGFAAKMSVFAYEGDDAYDGDHFTVNGKQMSNAANPASNFFNSTRSSLGMPVSGSFDVPAFSGGSNSMGGYDLDVVDVTSVVAAGDTSAVVGADSALDIFFLGGFVTSITNKSPDFGSMTKSAVDVNAGAVLPGDVIEYTVAARNDGNDTAVGSVIVDVLDAGLAFVPGSIKVLDGGNLGAKTDAKADDQGEYDAATKTVTVRVGTGASGTLGGALAPGETAKISFQAKVVATMGSIPNQGSITAAGQAGGPKKTWLSDGDSTSIGSQPTVVVVNECNTDAMCSGTKPHCDTKTHTCVPCATDSDCSNPATPACEPTGACGQCSKTNVSACTSQKPVCDLGTDTCAVCTTGAMGDATKCKNDPAGPVCVAGMGATFCGCTKDADCGNTTSGKVCDTATTETCIPGCRGIGGNGCPTGLVCTSKDSSIGMCVTGTGGSGGAAGSSAAGSGGTVAPRAARAQVARA